MKITGVRVESYKWPRRRPISNGLHTYTHSGVGFIFIDTDDGVTGVGIGATNAAWWGMPSRTSHPSSSARTRSTWSGCGTSCGCRSWSAAAA